MERFRYRTMDRSCLWTKDSTPPFHGNDPLRREPGFSARATQFWSIHCYTRAVTDQETVDRLAVLAKPRLTSLLRLKNVRHVYDPTPGELNSTVVEDSHEVVLNKWKSATQPYRAIERFLVDEQVMQYIVVPGLLPVVMALSKEIMGKKLLVTRKVAARPDDKGVVSHLDGFGVRIMLYFDEAAGDTILEWACLYGVA